LLRNFDDVLHSRIEARHVMSRKVRAVEPTTSISDLKAMMETEGFHHLLVMKKDKLLGIISDRDIANRKGRRASDVFLPGRLVAKLRRFWRWKRERGEDRSPAGPLFANQSGHRISKRRVQFAWATWQRRAGFDRVYGFHCLRHSAISSVYRMTHDLYLAQRFARHVSPLTTTVSRAVPWSRALTWTTRKMILAKLTSPSSGSNGPVTVTSPTAGKYPLVNFP
jgi:integrase